MNFNDLLKKTNEELKQDMSNIIDKSNLLYKQKEKEIKKVLEIEKLDYEEKKRKFYSNPLNWTNNKRRMKGLPPLRGKKYKNRRTKYPAYRPTPKIFFLIEEAIDDILCDNFKNNTDYFNNFVSIKDMRYGTPSLRYSEFLVEEKIND